MDFDIRIMNKSFFTRQTSAPFSGRLHTLEYKHTLFITTIPLFILGPAIALNVVFRNQF